MSDLFVDMQQKRVNRAVAAARSCSNVSSSTTNASVPSTVKAPSPVEEEDEFANILSLQLRKPKHWKWELSTSRSCSNIALPRILLYDHKGALLLDADNQSEKTYKQEAPKPSSNISPNHSTTRGESRKRPQKSRAATTNLAQSIRQALNLEFNGLQIQEATPSPVPTNPPSVPSTTPTTPSTGAIDFYSNDLPDYKFQRRANSLKGVRFKDDGYAKGPLIDLPTPPSTITTNTTATPTTSSSSGPREKRRYRRSNSSGRSPGQSHSILERFSFNKGRFSSPEYAEEHNVYHSPRYFLRTSKAGTLVVQEESFSRYRRRRKPRNSSTENMQTESGSRNSLKTAENGFQTHLKVFEVPERQTASLQNVAELEQGARKKVYPVRRYRSDGNVLLQKELSTSEEELADKEKTSKKDSLRQRRYANFRRASKKEFLPIDPGNNVLMHSFGSATSR